MINLQETFEKFSHEEFLKFDRIENPVSKRADLCAFIRLEQLIPADSRDIVSGAEHDVIYLNVDIEKLAEVATEDDILFLVRCGVMYVSEYDSLKMFV